MVSPVWGGIGRFADQEAQDVGLLGQIALAGAVADLLDGHRRQGPEAVGQRGHDRRAGGRGQFGLDVGGGQRNAAEQLRRGGRGNVALAVGDGDAAGAGGDGRYDQALRAEQVPADGRADDIGDRVDRADLVEVDLLDRGAMHLGLDLGQPLEDPPRGVFLAGREPAAVDHGLDMVQVPVLVFRLVCDGDLGCAEAVFLDLLGDEFHARQAERGDGRVERSSGTPASTKAPRVMSPLMPLGQSR